VAKKAALALHPVISKRKGLVFLMAVMPLAGRSDDWDGHKTLSGMVTSFGPSSGEAVCG
jgi:hypothetical protein